MCLRTGLGDLKNTKHLKLIYGRFFYAFLKNGKNHIFREFLKSSVAHVKIVVCFFFLSELGKQKPSELDQTILRR